MIVEMAFFFTFCCNREGRVVYWALSMGEKDDTQHLLSSLHAIKNMRNYMWIMNKTLPDPLSSNGAAISIAKLRHRLHCLGEFDANLVLFSWTDKGFLPLNFWHVLILHLWEYFNAFWNWASLYPTNFLKNNLRKKILSFRGRLLSRDRYY